MIIGEVTPDREAVISLTILGLTGANADIRAIIDTGFTEYLTLPPAVVASLGLPFNSTTTALLADDTVVDFDEYVASINWDGELREIIVIESAGEPLIGMTLLQGYRLAVDGVDGGPVTITRL